MWLRQVEADRGGEKFMSSSVEYDCFLKLLLRGKTSDVVEGEGEWEDCSF